MKIDQITLVCTSCKCERLYYPNPPLTSALAFDTWIKTKATRFVCGAETCNAKLRLANEEKG